MARHNNPYKKLQISADLVYPLAAWLVMQSWQVERSQNVNMYKFMRQDGDPPGVMDENSQYVRIYYDGEVSVKLTTPGQFMMIEEWAERAVLGIAQLPVIRKPTIPIFISWLTMTGWELHIETEKFTRMIYKSEAYILIYTDGSLSMKNGSPELLRSVRTWLNMEAHTKTTTFLKN